MKQVKIKNKNFSKIICGTNPFYGHSHFSKARDAEYLKRFNDSAIREVLTLCLDFGINAVETCANERITKNILDLKESTKKELKLIGSTRIDETSEMKSHQEKLNFLLKKKADICIIHSQFVDRPRRTDEINGLHQMVQKIHNAGLLAGISTHRVETVELCEKKKYGIDVYLFPLNKTGFVFPGYKGNETVEERIELIQKTKKPFILMKTLAAGRIPPDEGLKFVLENSKENDLISIGLGSVDETRETLDIINNLLV